MSPPQHDGDRKRLRIAIACSECHDRKRKCDGVKPIYDSCAKRSSAQCVWEEGRNSKRASEGGSALSTAVSPLCLVAEDTEGFGIPYHESRAAPTTADMLEVNIIHTPAINKALHDSTSRRHRNTAEPESLDRRRVLDNDEDGDESVIEAMSSPRAMQCPLYLGVERMISG